MRPPSRSLTPEGPGRWVAHPLPAALRATVRRLHLRWPRDILIVSVARQRLTWYTRTSPGPCPPAPPAYHKRARFVVSTSAHGLGQVRDSHRTPLGLHRIGAKVGRGWPVGTAFKARLPVGFVWQGMPDAPIAHRILWLDGLEPGHNRGGTVDTRSRYIYLHGLADEPTLGRPASQGCVHLAAANLIPLFDRLAADALVWITASP